MKNIKILSCLLFGMNFINCCTQKNEPREPISHRSGEFMKQSIERNKKLNKKEENVFANIIENDTTIDYIASSKGYWYYYQIKSDKEDSKPQKGQIAYFEYEVKDINENIIYSKEELKPQQYIIDKQNIMKGLSDGLKLMQKGEKITFLFPSHMAYGYHGDNNKIGTNEPLICTVTLNDIVNDTVSK